MRLWVYGVCGLVLSAGLVGLWRWSESRLGGPPGGGVESWWQTPRGAGSVEAEDWARWT
jgi:hypothetical protein